MAIGYKPPCRVSKYKHKKYAKLFTSSYRFTIGEREFILSGTVGGKARNISFESPQAAKSLGWKRVK